MTSDNIQFTKREKEGIELGREEASAGEREGKEERRVGTCTCRQKLSDVTRHKE